MRSATAWLLIAAMTVVSLLFLALVATFRFAIPLIDPAPLPPDYDSGNGPGVHTERTLGRAAEDVSRLLPNGLRGRKSHLTKHWRKEKARFHRNRAFQLAVVRLAFRRTARIEADRALRPDAVFSRVPAKFLSRTRRFSGSAAESAESR